VLSVKAGTSAGVNAGGVSGASGGVTAEISATGWLTATAAATAALSALGTPSTPVLNTNSGSSDNPYAIANLVKSAGLGSCSVSRPQPSVGGLRPGERGPPVEVHLDVFLKCTSSSLSFWRFFLPPITRRFFPSLQSRTTPPRHPPPPLPASHSSGPFSESQPCSGRRMGRP